MRYCIVCLLLVIVSFGQVNAQENRNGFRLDTIYKPGAKRQVVKAPVKKSVPLKSSVSRKVGKWTLSGSCGMSFGDYTSIDVSPQIGYRWNEFFSAGGGVSYNYHHSSNRYDMNYLGYNPQIQISAESETKRSIFREKDKTKRSKKESAQHSKSRNKSFVMTSVSAL